MTDEEQNDLDGPIVETTDATETPAAIEPPAPVEPTTPEPPPFELASDEIPNFTFLQECRRGIFSRRRRLESFRLTVAGLEQSGESGRRKGLGLWMLGNYQAAESLLAGYEDAIATFTRANALLSAGRFADALPIFERLCADDKDDHPRPRSGMLQARLEGALEGGMEHEEAANVLEKELGEAPDSFAKTADGHYLRGRLLELRREWEGSLDAYITARELDACHRRNLFHLAHLAERWGLDDLAVEAYQTLVAMPPIDRNVLMNLGVLYEDLGRDQEAAACYDTVVKSHPTDRQARLYLEDARAGMDMYYDEDLERKEDRLNQILRIPITDFELSVRARNCLNKMNILTLGDLVKKSETELLSYKNFGETSLNEIKEILSSKGLRLGMARDEAVASIESSARRYTTGDNVEAMNTSIQDLELSIRARRTVEALGCLTLGDIVQHTEDELLGMPNFGVTSLQELKEKLSEHALALKPKDGKVKK